MEETTAQTTSALDVYGAGDDIKKLADRIKLCLPGGDRLGRNEALALAQLSVAYQLNPFNGEVWYIMAKDGTPKGTQVGIKGLRKTARRQGNYWIRHELLMPDEKEQLNIPPNAIAFRCAVYRTDLMLEAAKIIRAMREAGVEDAVERYAYSPAVGIGYWMPGEQTKMKPDQAARKRAEADGLKQAFDLPFASETGNGDAVGFVDTEWAEAQPTTSPRNDRALAAEYTPRTAEEIRDAVRRQAWGDSEVRVMAGEPITPKQEVAVAGLLSRAMASEGMTQREIDQDRYDVMDYLLGVRSTKSLTKREASAIIEWLRFDDGEHAVAECATVLHAVAKEAGQQPLL